MNLYGGYMKVAGGMIIASDGQPNTLSTLTIYGGVGGGGVLSLPRSFFDDGTIGGWITNGYLIADGDGPGAWMIYCDLTREEGRVLLTSVPEPATITLLCLGGLSLIRKKQS